MSAQPFWKVPGGNRIGEGTTIALPVRQIRNTISDGGATARSPAQGNNAMSPLVTALTFFGAFLLVGLIAKVAIGMWMKRQ